MFGVGSEIPLVAIVLKPEQNRSFPQKLEREIFFALYLLSTICLAVSVRRATTLHSFGMTRVSSRILLPIVDILD